MVPPPQDRKILSTTGKTGTVCSNDENLHPHDRTTVPAVLNYYMINYSGELSWI
jgi:hypothetical protein